MSEAHTPGPWKIVNRTDVQSEPIGGLAYVSTAGARGRTLDEAIANAHLIAAAPDLLAALEFIDRNNAVDRTSTRMLRAAIAKARGITSPPVDRTVATCSGEDRPPLSSCSACEE
jgi:hypothetical protein